MDFKLENFFIGVIDFFSVLLPGALLTWFFMNKPFLEDFSSVENGFAIPESTGGQVVVFIIVAYITGGLIFVFASILDDLVYGPMRNLIYMKNNDHAFKCAGLIRKRYIPEQEYFKQFDEQKLSDLQERTRRKSVPFRELFLLRKRKRSLKRQLNDRYILNEYKWAQYYLQIKHPELGAEIKRIEADSKFFRSLVIAFLVIAIYYFFMKQFNMGYIMLALTALSFYRYGILRYKSTERAYEAIVAAEHLEKFSATEPENKRIPDNMDHYAVSGDAASEIKRNIHLLVGKANQKSKIFSIPANTQLRMPAQFPSMYCFSGSGRVTNKDGLLDPVIINKGGIIHIDKFKPVDISTFSDEPLILVEIKQD